jgi:nicotinamidase/pyrazinamidase
MRALILVDIQNDFMPTGALPVPNGHEVVPVANKLMPRFDLVVATQDWHPETHGSFAKHHGKQPGEVIDLNGLQQVLWPHHCVQDTKGAEFVKELDASKIDAVFQKGTDPGIDSYSGFHDNGHRKATGLGDYLKKKGVDEVYVLGVATDYCVRFTALDAVREGFKTTLVEDGSRGVNLQPGDSAKAIEEMRAAGVKVMRSAEVS